MGESADTDVTITAISRSDSAGEVGEEFSMTHLDIGVPMLPRGEHELNVTPEIIVPIVVSERGERVDEKLGQLEIQCVFPRAKKLVIVDAGLTPVLSLLMQNFATCVKRFVF